MKKPANIRKAVLIYDGACPVCSRTIKWIKANARRGMFEMIPCQSDAVKERYPSIDRATCMQAMQLVLPDGTALSGEKSLPEIVKRLKRYSPAADIFKLPGSEILTRAFYRWFADRRYHIAKLLFGNEKQRGRKAR